MRKLQRYSVNIPKRLLQQLEQRGDVQQSKKLQGVFVEIGGTLYDKTWGVLFDGVSLIYK